MNSRPLDRESTRLPQPSVVDDIVPHRYVPEAHEPPQESLLAEYLRILKRRRWLVLQCALAGLALALLFGLTTEPIYRTRTSLEIKNLNGDFMDIRSVAPTGDNSAAEGDTNLQTQIKLLQSDTLTEHVSRNLLNAPHPSTIERQDLVSRAARALHLNYGAAIPYTDLVADTAKRVTVKPLGVTRLVEVTCESWDRAFAAEYCNELSNSYEELDLQTRSTEAQKTSEWLTHQVADVRARAEESQKKLEQAVGGNGLMLSQNVNSAGEARLNALQDELVKAQADRMQKQADSSLISSADAGTLPSVQDNPAHRAYELKLADLNTQIAALVPPLTEANPKVIKLRAQIKDAEAGLRATASLSTRRESNEYAAAKHREDLLKVAYDAQQATVSSDLQKAAQVSLLRRELDSEQQLYQTLLQRAKEAGFASAMQASTIRVVDAAQPPKVAYSPQRKLAGGAGLALGSLFGFGLAFYRERNSKVFRLPGDVERYLHVHEIGVIPSIRRTQPKLLHNPKHLKERSLPAVVEGKSNAITLTGWNDRFSVAAEAYRNATLSILLSDQSKRARTYVVSSPSAGEGKTTITSNLGVALSKSKLRVVLIDGDLRRPNLHRAFGLANNFGLRNILRGETELETIATDTLARSTGLANVSLVAAGEGTEDSVELLHSTYFAALLTRLSRDFDVILIDSPPILHMADARILAGQSDGAILIFRAGVTTRDQAATARDLIDNDGVRLVGTILNDFDPVREGQANYYSSYYRYAKAGETEKMAANL